MGVETKYVTWWTDGGCGSNQEHQAYNANPLPTITGNDGETWSWQVDNHAC